MMRYIGRMGLVAMVLAIMCGCGDPRTPQPSLTPTSVPSATLTASPTLDPTVTPTAGVAIKGTPSDTRTPRPTPEPPVLTSREPSVEDLAEYLAYYYPEELDIWDSGPPDFTSWLGDLEWLFEDVSGDDDPDLVILGSSYVAVLVWKINSYTLPYQDLDHGGRYRSAARSYLHDWTGDGVPEIVFETYGDTGGTGYVTGGWGRSIIYCREDGCNEAWLGSIGALAHDSNSGGMARTDTQLKLIAQEDGSIWLEHSVQSFVLFCCYDWRETGFLDGLKTESYVNTYRWIDSKFKLVGKQILQEEVRMKPPPIAPATNEFGAVASIKSEYNRALGMYNNNCQLTVDGKSVGELFGCRDFVTIQWRDITGDEQIELVVMALSTVYLILPDEPLIFADCYHQRLIAYEWNQTDGIGDQIANVIGCVVQSDLYGVRLEDLDSDGSLEIIVAAKEITDHEPYEWFEFDNHDEIYRWNGSEYVYSETVTRE